MLAAGTVGAVFDGESPPHAAAANMTEAPQRTTINERERSRRKLILVTSDVTEHPGLLITVGPQIRTGPRQKRKDAERGSPVHGATAMRSIRRFCPRPETRHVAFPSGHADSTRRATSLPARSTRGWPLSGSHCRRASPFSSTAGWSAKGPRQPRRHRKAGPAGHREAGTVEQQPRASGLTWPAIQCFGERLWQGVTGQRLSLFEHAGLAWREPKLRPRSTASLLCEP